MKAIVAQKTAFGKTTLPASILTKGLVEFENIVVSTR